jgi:hypothetical protein
MKQEFKATRFRKKSKGQIELISEIVAEYQRQGYNLTLRQLYYQLVAGGHIENSVISYKAIGRRLKDSRLSGMVDWDGIEDRARTLENAKSEYHTSLPVNIQSAVQKEIESCFVSTRWARQPYHVEIWVEKDALSEVAEKAARRSGCAFLACRGYLSSTVLYQAAERFKEKTANGQECVIVYAGDHDCSGIDMTRDIQDRLKLFGAKAAVRRVALNMDQIERYNPPPNPAKETDKRFQTYAERFGTSTWELDALKPQILSEIFYSAAVDFFNDEIYQENQIEAEEYKADQRERYAEVMELLGKMAG